MQHDRNRGRERAERGRAATRNDIRTSRARVDRYASSASSSGCRVVEQVIVDARRAELALVALDQRTDRLQVVLAHDDRHGQSLPRLSPGPRTASRARTETRARRGSSTWNTMTSVPRNRKCFSPRITRSGSSSRSEISTTMPRLRATRRADAAASTRWSRCPSVEPIERDEHRTADGPAARSPAASSTMRSSNAVSPTASRWRFIR